jgi:hypothetical protein
MVFSVCRVGLLRCRQRRMYRHGWKISRIGRRSQGYFAENFSIVDKQKLVA